MSTPKERNGEKRIERPVQHHQDPGAPKTTEAVPEAILPTIRLALRATPPKIPPGVTVEIDLFGEGIEAAYASLIVRDVTDAEHVIDAADQLVPALRDLEQARAENRDRRHVAFWSTLINRLHRVEHHLSRSGVDGAASLAVLASQANRRIALALRDGVELGASDWEEAENLLSSAGVECLGLAERVEENLRDGPEPPLSFGPLSEGSSYANSDDLNAGLISAARLGLDLNELEVGHYAGGDVARIIRGKALRKS